jgi:hypothetical protein
MVRSVHGGVDALTRKCLSKLLFRFPASVGQSRSHHPDGDGIRDGGCEISQTKALMLRRLAACVTAQLTY